MYSDLLLPLLPTFCFFVFEQIKINQHFLLRKRELNLFLIGVMAIGISIIFSDYCLKTLVDFYDHFTLMSLSEVSIPRILSITISILVMDFTQYLVHRINHKIPLMWRLHRLHHSDKSVDAFTNLLHHPVEVFLNSTLVIAFYVIFDIPVILITNFAVFSMIHSAFSHNRILIPEKIERYLRYIIITPNTHRIHHAKDLIEGNSNFGSVFPFWDMLLGTYMHKDILEVNKTDFGISSTQSPPTYSIKNLLINPFIHS